MSHLLYLWREQRDVALSPGEIQRRLDGGEDVEGLADLPIKDLIEAIKREFSGCKEMAGQLMWAAGGERFVSTWSWQYLRVESENLIDEHRDKFLEIAQAFGCPVYDPQLNIKI